MKNNKVLFFLKSNWRVLLFLFISESSISHFSYSQSSNLDSIVNINNLCSNLPVTLINKTLTTSLGTVTKIEIFWDVNNNPTLNTTYNSPVAGASYTYKYAEFGTPASKNYTIVVRLFTNAKFMDDTINISLNASPKIQFNAIPAICQEKDPITLNQASDIYHLAPDAGVYSGFGVVGGNQFDPRIADPGAHLITYSDTTSFGCVASAYTTLTVYPTPIISMPNNRVLLSGSSVQLIPTVTGNIQSIIWSPSNFLNNPDTLYPVANPTSNITYTLTATSTQGCVGDSSVFVRVVLDFDVPNTFTPNNDGINDFWTIKQLPQYPIQWVQVFDRYGQIVFETHHYDDRGWDGTYNGKSLPFGTYYYIIELNGIITPKVGYVTILK